jgi:hypothetical protein
VIAERGEFVFKRFGTADIDTDSIFTQPIKKIKLGYASKSLPPDFSATTLYSFIVSPMRTIRPALITVFDLITRIVLTKMKYPFFARDMVDFLVISQYIALKSLNNTQKP